MSKLMNKPKSIQDTLVKKAFQKQLESRSRLLPIKDENACKEIGKRVNKYKEDSAVESWSKDLKEFFPDCSEIVELSPKENVENKVDFKAYAVRYKPGLPLLYLLIMNEKKNLYGLPKLTFSSEAYFDLFDQGPFKLPNI